MIKGCCLLCFSVLCMCVTRAQVGRITDRNQISWPQLFMTIRLNKHLDVHGEYQWRRTNGFRNGQQCLFRTALQYRFNEQVSAQIGYAWVETYSYGDYPIAANGRFPEHRLYQQLLLQQPLNRLRITHRFRTEQRFLGKIKPGTQREVEDWVYLNRFRYMIRAQQQLFAKKQTRFYCAVADELFIGAGEKIGLNVFDQNRLSLLAGIISGKQIQAEAGFLQQILQQGSPVNSRAVFQKNNGWVLAVYLKL